MITHRCIVARYATASWICVSNTSASRRMAIARCDNLLMRLDTSASAMQYLARCKAARAFR